MIGKEKIMKAAVFYGKNDLRVEERRMPEINDDEVLMRVRACGICGTDIHIFSGDEGAAPTPPNTVLGHEFAGEVIETGRNVTGFKQGDKVCVDPNKLCGSCDFCHSGKGHFCTSMVGIGTTVDGGFEEYCAVPASQVYKVDGNVTFEQAAMAEPVSCCLHGIELCNITCGDTVLIIGCGMIGLIMLQLARLSGAAKIIAIDPIKEKRELALKLGADTVFDPITENVSDSLKNVGCEQIDTVIECVGKPETIEQAISLAGKRSTVMMFGLTKVEEKISVKPFEIFKKEITLKSSFINPYTFPAAVKLISGGKIDVSSMIYKCIPLETLPAVLADRKLSSAGKYIVTL